MLGKAAGRGERDERDRFGGGRRRRAGPCRAWWAVEGVEGTGAVGTTSACARTGWVLAGKGRREDEGKRGEREQGRRLAGQRRGFDENRHSSLFFSFLVQTYGPLFLYSTFLSSLQCGKRRSVDFSSSSVLNLSSRKTSAATTAGESSSIVGDANATEGGRGEAGRDERIAGTREGIPKTHYSSQKRGG